MKQKEETTEDLIEEINMIQIQMKEKLDSMNKQITEAEEALSRCYAPDHTEFFREHEADKGFYLSWVAGGENIRIIDHNDRSFRLTSTSATLRKQAIDVLPKFLKIILSKMKEMMEEIL